MTPWDQLQQGRAALSDALGGFRAALDREKGRKRGVLIRHIHEISRALDPAFPFASQAGQDVIVDRIFRGKTGGTFVDVGGYDGVTGSNTLFLEQRRGWTGALVEPVPDLLARARMARKCPCLHYAVAAEQGEAEFMVVTEGLRQMSGLSSQYDPGILKAVRADPRHREMSLTLQTRTLSQVLIAAAIPHPDFISLDIEGGELAALSVFPFVDHRVGVWAIENNTANPALRALMEQNGYALVEYCGADEIYRLMD